MMFARRLILFAVISVFTLGLGLLALFDGIEMLAASASYIGNDRNALLGLGALTTAGGLLPIAVLVIAALGVFVKGPRWGGGLLARGRPVGGGGVGTRFGGARAGGASPH